MFTRRMLECNTVQQTEKHFLNPKFTLIRQETAIFLLVPADYFLHGKPSILKKGRLTLGESVAAIWGVQAVQCTWTPAGMGAPKGIAQKLISLMIGNPK